MEQDLLATLALLAATPATLDALLRELPETLTHVSEDDGGWTVAQVLAHLIHGERTDWLPRVQIILRAGESETFPAFQREAHRNDSRSVGELLDEFANLRTLGLAQLRALHLTAQDLDRRGRHPDFGVVTLSQLLATWPAHDLTHLHQISRILASQYRQPWVHGAASSAFCTVTDTARKPDRIEGSQRMPSIQSAERRRVRPALPQGVALRGAMIFFRKSSLGQFPEGWPGDGRGCYLMRGGSGPCTTFDLTPTNRTIPVARGRHSPSMTISAKSYLFTGGLALLRPLPGCRKLDGSVPGRLRFD